MVDNPHANPLPSNPVLEPGVLLVLGVTCVSGGVGWGQVFMGHCGHFILFDVC